MGLSNGIYSLLSLICSYPDRPVSERASIPDYHYRVHTRKLNEFPGNNMAWAGENRAIARISGNWELFTVIAGVMPSRRLHRSSICRVSHSRIGSQHGCAGVISLLLEIQQIIRHEQV